MIKKYPISYYLIFILFAWYVLYTGLALRVPYYGSFDDFIFMLMFLLSITKAALIPNGRINLTLLTATTMIFYTLVLSTVYNSIHFLPFIKFTYIVSRSLIVAFFISTFKLNAETIMNTIVKWSRFLIFANLPFIVLNLITVNTKLLLSQYHDSIIGFFPFINTDSLSILYLLVFYKDFYDHVYLKKNRWLPLILVFFLLLTTLNMKYITLTLGTLIMVVTLKTRRRLFYITAMFVLLFYPLYTLLPIYEKYLSGISLIPIFNIIGLILTGNVMEYNFFLGTGPGSFTSPVAIQDHSFLTQIYLGPFIDYWSHLTVTGTFTRLTSSVSTLLGEIGVIGLLVYLFFILLMLKRAYLRLSDSFIFLVGFFAGINCMVLGIFLNYWFWGVDLLLLLLSNFGANIINNNRKYSVLSQRRLGKESG